jgi:hypothetical protein
LSGNLTSVECAPKRSPLTQSWDGTRISIRGHDPISAASAPSPSLAARISTVTFGHITTENHFSAIFVQNCLKQNKSARCIGKPTLVKSRKVIVLLLKYKLIISTVFVIPYSRGSDIRYSYFWHSDFVC